ASLRFEPRLHLVGPLDAVVDDEIGAHLISVLREGLSNVVRHAHASRVEVTVSVADARVRAEVRDDGVGPGTGSRAGGRGLANISHRAESLGGHMSLAAGPDGGGTSLVWQVPLAAHSPSGAAERNSTPSP